MKKRFMAVLLCLCLLMGVFAAAAYANGAVYANFDLNEEADYAYQTEDIDIEAIAEDNQETNTVHVYKVEITWGDMAFAYGELGRIENKWDAENHSYSYPRENKGEGWMLLNDGTPLTLYYNNDGSYNAIVANTDQNYLGLFNHSDMPVDAHVYITDVNVGTADDQGVIADDNILAILNKAAFGLTATESAAGGFEYALPSAGPAADAEDRSAPTPFYVANNSAFLYVEMDEKAPKDNTLNTTDHQPIATITVNLSLPTEDEAQTPSDDTIIEGGEIVTPEQGGETGGESSEETV